MEQRFGPNVFKLNMVMKFWKINKDAKMTHLLRLGMKSLAWP